MSSPWTAPGADPAAPEPTAATEPAPGHEQRGTATVDGAALAERRELVARAPLFPLRPLGLGEILGAATRIYRDRPRIVLSVSAVVFAIVFVLVTVLSGVSMLPLLGSMQAALDAPDAQTAPLSVDLTQSLATMAGSLVAGSLSTVAVQVVTVVIAAVTIGEATGRPLTDAEAWAALRRHGVPAMLAGLLTAALTLLAVVVPVVLGSLPLLLTGQSGPLTVIPFLLALGAGLLLALWLWARSCLLAPALAIEDLGPVAALRRSFALTRGRRLWRVLGISVLLSLLASMVAQVISGFTGVIGVVAYVGILLASQMSQLMLGVGVLLVITMLGAFLASMIAQPFLSSGVTALYADQRMRHEAWDVELARASRSARADALGR